MRGVVYVFFCMITIHATEIVYVRLGYNITFQCPKTPVDSWQIIDSKEIVALCQKSGNILNEQITNITNKMFVSPTCQLGINNFSDTDHRDFQCITKNSSYKFYVRLPIPPTNMVIDEANEKLEVYGVTGEPTTITCRVNSGIPQETITWKRYNEIISSGGPSILKYTFVPEQFDEKIKMTCTANNTALSITKQVIFRILEKPIVMIQATPHATIQEGDTIVLICESTIGGRVDKFDWKHNGVCLESNSSKFMITFTTKSDAGLYSCNASNKAGYSIDNMTVIVQYAPDVKNANVVFPLDEMIRNLRCEASGIPNEYTFDRWQHFTFQNQFIRHLQGSENGILSLPYNENEDQRYLDSGIYICAVSNNVSGIRGGWWQTGRVNCRPILANRNETAIQFGYFNSTSYIVLNVLSSSAISNVTWFDEDMKVLKINEFCTLTMTVTTLFGEEISISGHRCSMTIVNTKPEDFQKYTVQIDNEVGRNHFKIILKSASTPVEPDIKSITPNRDDITFGWIPRFDGGQNQSFIVEYRKRFEDTWTNFTLQCNAKKDMQLSIIYGLQPDTEYEIRMFAFNNIGRSNVTNTFVAKTKEKKTDLTILYVILGLLTLFFISIAAVRIIHNCVKEGKETHFRSNELGRSPEEAMQGESIQNDLYHSAAADVVRPEEAHGTRSDMYSVIHSRHSISARNKAMNKVPQIENRNSTNITANDRTKIPNGTLNYVDVVFHPFSSERRYYIHGKDKRTPYADIDFAAKVDPSSLSSNDSSSSEKDNDEDDFIYIECITRWGK